MDNYREINLSIIREMLDRVVLVNNDHIKEICQDYQMFYNSKRPHQGTAGKQPIEPKNIESKSPNVCNFQVKKTLELDGLITCFELAA